MAHNLTAARPYARALFEQANEHNTVSSWLSLLELLSFVASDKTISRFWNAPNVSDETWLRFFTSICEQAAEKQTQPIKTHLNHFLSLLIENKRLNVLPDIHVLFQQQLSEQQGIAEVKAISAFPLSEDQCALLQTSLEKRLGSAIKLETTVDQELIGGVLVRTRNWVLDASIKGQLARFKQTLLGLGG